MMHLYFSDIFEVSTKVLDKYGAFNISLVTDLPLSGRDSRHEEMTGCGFTPAEIAIVEGKK